MNCVIHQHRFNHTGNVVIPFWPKEQFVQLCAQGVWQGYTARSIPLEDFLSKWLPGMQKEAITRLTYSLVVQQPPASFNLSLTKGTVYPVILF